jgi:ABC-2 type transport system permease protein
MTAFARFFAKELREIFRTWRLPVVGGLVLFFAISGPVLAMLTPELLRSVQSSQPGVVIQVPEPTWIDAYAQWVKNLSQIVAFAAIIAVAGSVASEIASGTAAIVVTKPVSRTAFVFAKWGAFYSMLAPVVLLGAGATQLVTYAVFSEAPAERLWAATLVWLAFAGVLSAVGVLFSCLVSTLAAAALTMAAFVVISVAAIWRPLAEFTFAGLAIAPQAILAADRPALAWPLATAAAAVVLLLATAAFAFGRREI